MSDTEFCFKHFLRGLPNSIGFGPLGGGHHYVRFRRQSSFFDFPYMKMMCRFHTIDFGESFQDFRRINVLRYTQH